MDPPGLKRFRTTGRLLKDHVNLFTEFFCENSVMMIPFK